MRTVDLPPDVVICLSAAELAEDFVPSTSSPMSVESSSFRFRDLPEELQGQIIRLCIPEWSVRLHKSPDHRCTRTENQNNLSHDPTLQQVSSYCIQQFPRFEQPLFLVDKRMNELARAQTALAFDGKLWTRYFVREYQVIIHDSDVDDCHCQPPDVRRQAKADALQSVWRSITTVRGWMSRFSNFDLDLLDILPNLQLVVAQDEQTLFEESIYGFGSEEFLTKHISEEALLKLLHRSLLTPDLPFRITMLRKLFQAKVRPILEIKVSVGASTTKFWFMCIFRLDAGPETDPIKSTILARYSAQAWEKLDEQMKYSLYRSG